MALIAMAFPIASGKTEQWRRFIDTLNGSRNRDFVESRRRVGVHERTFFQSTPQGDMVIVTMEGDDPMGAFQRLSTMNDDFSNWFREQVAEVHGVDLNQPLPGPAPEMAIDSSRGGISQR